MRYGSTKGYRRSYRYRRHRRSYATRTRRTRRRYYRRRSRTISSVIKLTYDATWQFGGGPNTWSVFSFNPLLLPGFKDYQSTFTHFRVLKAKLFVNRQIQALVAATSPTPQIVDGSKWNYLVVGSRPFASTTPPVANNALASAFVPDQSTDALRQTKWQRVHYPSTTTQRVSIGFYPYTMVGTFGPTITTGVGNQNVQYQRIWEGKKWMPFTWALDQTGVDRVMSFFGPYMVADAPPELQETQYMGLGTNCTLQVSVQFKGQR
ncbi:putative capsid protein [Fly associated circular virus 7]|uniref:Putative capsid protein n=1 Tax=Fly associated circular virus 7 TaxID=2293287 RepID=A0A346BPC7_9VIRU|nr:putative capsid protein [Fly associated circular virus 7]AXL65924.1 putative capsid protein [Fly associated circular virus 7]